MKLGRLGVWYGTDRLDGSQLRDFVRTVEKKRTQEREAAAAAE